MIKYEYFDKNSKLHVVEFPELIVEKDDFDKNEIIKEAKKYHGVDKFAKDHRDMFGYMFNNGLANELCEVYKEDSRYCSWNQFLSELFEAKSRRELKMRYSISYTLFKLYTDLLQFVYGDKRRYSPKSAEEALYYYSSLAELYYNDYDLFLFIRNRCSELFKYFPEHSQKEWKIDEIIEHSKRYERYIDFYECEPYACVYADYNDLYDEKITHLKGKPRGNNYWTPEVIQLFAKKFEYQIDLFIKYPGIEIEYCRNDYIKELLNKCFDEEHKCRPREYTYQNNKVYAVNHKYSYDDCYELAEFCKSCTEMSAKYVKAYKIAKENGWVKDYKWFFSRTDYMNDIYCVYCNIDEDLKVVYVGLTKKRRLDDRYREHKKSTDVLATYFNNINKPIPKPIVIKDNLTPEEAQYYEDYYRNDYIQKGYNVLNIAATGVGTGSVGGCLVKWTKDACYEEAKKYTKYYDFMILSSSAYSRAREMGYLGDYTWLERQNHENHTPESLLEKAKEYEYWEDFSNKYYDAARYHGVFDQIKEMLPSRIEEYKQTFNFEYCVDIAKQFTKTRDFYTNAPVYYNFCTANDYIKHFYWFKQSFKHWTYDVCYNEFKKYSSLDEFEKNCYGGYHMSVEQGWINDFISGNYNEYKANRMLAYKYDDYIFKLDRRLLNSGNESEKFYIDKILSYNPFDRYTIENGVLLIDGISFMKYNDCNMYYKNNELYFIKRDLSRKYPHLFRIKNVRKFMSLMKPLPEVNDFDNIDIDEIREQVKFANFVDREYCRYYFDFGYYGTCKDVDYSNIEQITYIQNCIKEQYNNNYTKPVMSDINGYFSKNKDDKRWWLCRGWNEEISEQKAKEYKLFAKRIV